MTSSAFAADKELFPTSEFKLGYEGMYMYYDEPDVMHEKGILNGGFGSWTGYFSDYNIMLNAELEALPDHCATAVNTATALPWNATLTTTSSVDAPQSVWP